jgi:predicted amidohydrolase
MQETLNIALVQNNPEGNDIQKNLKNIDNQLTELNNKPNLIVLPEFFASGFLIQVPQNEVKFSPDIIHWMKDKASDIQCYIGGSLVMQYQEGFANTFVLVSPSGEVCSYQKRHLFNIGNENNYFIAGNSRCITNIYGWRVNLQICYDLRFPVWSRNRNDYDLLIYTANWPGSRHSAWQTLLKARAIENQAYVLGINRTGTDANNVEYLGNSQGIDYKGNVIKEAGEKDEIVEFSINSQRLNAYRKNFPAWKDADDFRLL